MLLLRLFPIFQLLYALDDSTLVQKISDNNAPCKSCKLLVQSFEKGLERTKNHYGDKNTASEESEARFVDIYNSLCDTYQNQDMCFHTLNEYKNDLKEWWINGRQGELNQWFCIDKLKVCCPPKHYGPNCLPCKGYLNVCNSHGTCKGDGTRKGNGLCKCYNGYDGDNCDRCAYNYFIVMKNETLTCEQCHKSCKRGCTDSGPKGCNECKDGWMYMGKGKGCIDVNECIEQDVCTSQQFCVNNEGFYSCLNCDQSCKDCYGDGNDMCYNCAPGYTMKNKICTVSTEWKDADQSRYLTYIGLGIATLIIFRMDTTIASIVGVLLAVYIMMAEYLMNEFYKP
ncbi:Laminin EGF domain,EGF-like calcium-binding, conserved site,EGF-like, conserved site,EGF-like [Cinara cedri]|uniref:Laminin EGF domain,EGF-like calcium-binding, conserved site,EGF-like, conserved site,EGF-like n=1 Tax=Cinara cedri TaxID=506608 RepID=A0A5E4MGH9_9HEMI|nr:Laminin EGF domain,EGF-like calcium-binding, conserved site,EGF-like, conserved site,EGF-like [Cinara cedri]